jgi:general secretion pathway protein H
MAPRGFTLIELLVALAVMAAVLTVAVPLISNVMPGVTLKSAARDVAAALRTSRSRAISGNREATFTLDVGTRRYAVDGEQRVGTLAEDLEVSFVSARSERLDETTGIVRFYPDGSSTGGRVSLSRGEREYHVDVDWLTGRISIRD